MYCCFRDGLYFVPALRTMSILDCAFDGGSMSERTNAQRYATAAAVTLLLFVVQCAVSRLSWRAAALLPDFPYDADGLYYRLSLHHVFQMTFALLLMLILHRATGMRGFKSAPKYDRRGIMHVLIFCGVLMACYIAVYIVGSFLHSIAIYDYKLSAGNIIGTLTFQLLLSGPSEELLFRSLPIAVFLAVLKEDSWSNRLLAIVLAALLFAFGHCNVFTRSFPCFQMCYAFVLGLAYGYTFVKTRSVIYPMLMHSMSNVISVGGCYLYMLCTQ